MSTLFLNHPLTLTISTPHIYTNENKEIIIERIKQYIYENPFEPAELFLNNSFFHRVEIELGVAYGRVRRGEGKFLCDDFDYKSLN